MSDINEIQKRQNRRNTKGVWFSEAEYTEIVAEAKRLGLYPRQMIMLKIKKPS
jgi:hypothetical protein